MAAQRLVSSKGTTGDHVLHLFYTVWPRVKDDRSRIAATLRQRNRGAEFSICSQSAMLTPMDEVVRKIIHVDMDAFYASVEQRDNPGLRGKPVAVGHGARRGVVAAASYEARAFGVRSALPSLTAMRQCPELIFVPPRFDIYRSVSQQIHAIFAEFTDLIEPLALDEAYLDVSADRAGLATAWQTAKTIRARILTETGLTASAGISYNKFLAKLASGRRKPNGQFAIQPHEGEAFVEILPVTKFHGVGPATAKKMHELGILIGAGSQGLVDAGSAGSFREVRALVLRHCARPGRARSQP